MHALHVPTHIEMPTQTSGRSPRMETNLIRFSDPVVPHSANSILLDTTSLREASAWRKVPYDSRVSAVVLACRGMVRIDQVVVRSTTIPISTGIADGIAGHVSCRPVSSRAFDEKINVCPGDIVATDGTSITDPDIDAPGMGPDRQSMSQAIRDGICDCVSRELR